jgi:carboxylesterase
VKLAEIDLGEGTAGFVLGEGPVGILLIHGLTGTPTELRQVAKGLAKAGNCTVYVPTLAGHCGDNSDLQATGWLDWYEGVRKTFVQVKQRHEQVFVGGLSMGAVMSMYVASEHPGQVAGLLMYSTTLKYDGWSINKMAFITPLLIRIPFGVRLFRFTEKPPYGIKNERLRAIVERQMKEGESSEAGLLTMEGVTVRELHWMNAVVKKRMPRIDVPALVLHSIEDDITSRPGDQDPARQLLPHDHRRPAIPAGDRVECRLCRAAQRVCGRRLTGWRAGLLWRAGLPRVGWRSRPITDTARVQLELRCLGLGLLRSPTRGKPARHNKLISHNKRTQHRP